MTDRSTGYFFIHIPKTAGTSFRRMLYTEFPGEAIYPTHDEIVECGGNYPPQGALKSVEPQRKGRAHVLVGHYPIAAGKSFFGARPFMGMTFVREPTERAISNLLHLQRHAPQLRGLELNHIIEEAPHQLANLQVRFLCGLPGPLTDEHLSEAKRNLSQLAFLGITERFSESIANARAQLDWSLVDEIETNVRPVDTPPLDKDVIERLRAANVMDHELYEHACELFDARLSSPATNPARPQTSPATEQQRLATNRRQRFFERWLDPESDGLIMSAGGVPPIEGQRKATQLEIGPEAVDGWSWSNGDARFDYIVSDGVLEIMPDPISWLQGLDDALDKEGCAMLVHPDLRFAGQPERPLTTLGAAVQAHLDQTDVVPSASRFDSSYYKLDGPGPRMSFGHIGEPPNGHVTVTVFSPTSLREFVDATRRLGYHNLVVKRMFHRDDHPAEFFSLLTKEQAAAIN